MSDWISTKDRLPEEGKEVLVSTKSKMGSAMWIRGTICLKKVALCIVV